MNYFDIVDLFLNHQTKTNIIDGHCFILMT